MEKKDWLDSYCSNENFREIASRAWDEALDNAVSVEKHEFELTRSFELGIGSGYDSASKHLEEVAIELFKKRLDREALNVRKLSDDLRETGYKLSEIARHKTLEG